MSEERSFCGICCTDNHDGDEPCPALAELKCERCGGYCLDGRIVNDPCECLEVE